MSKASIPINTAPSTETIKKFTPPENPLIDYNEIKREVDKFFTVLLKDEKDKQNNDPDIKETKERLFKKLVTDEELSRIIDEAMPRIKNKHYKDSTEVVKAVKLNKLEKSINKKIRNELNRILASNNSLSRESKKILRKEFWRKINESTEELRKNLNEKFRDERKTKKEFKKLLNFIEHNENPEVYKIKKQLINAFGQIDSKELFNLYIQIFKNPHALQKNNKKLGNLLLQAIKNAEFVQTSIRERKQKKRSLILLTILAATGAIAGIIERQKVEVFLRENAAKILLTSGYTTEYIDSREQEYRNKVIEELAGRERTIKKEREYLNENQEIVRQDQEELEIDQRTLKIAREKLEKNQEECEKKQLKLARKWGEVQSQKVSTQQQVNNLKENVEELGKEIAQKNDQIDSLQEELETTKKIPDAPQPDSRIPELEKKVEEQTDQLRDLKNELKKETATQKQADSLKKDVERLGEEIIKKTTEINFLQKQLTKAKKSSAAPQQDSRIPGLEEKVKKQTEQLRDLKSELNRITEKMKDQKTNQKITKLSLTRKIAKLKKQAGVLIEREYNLAIEIGEKDRQIKKLTEENKRLRNRPVPSDEPKAIIKERVVAPWGEELQHGQKVEFSYGKITFEGTLLLDNTKVAQSDVGKMAFQMVKYTVDSSVQYRVLAKNETPKSGEEIITTHWFTLLKNSGKNKARFVVFMRPEHLPKGTKPNYGNRYLFRSSFEIFSDDIPKDGILDTANGLLLDPNTDKWVDLPYTQVPRKNAK